MMIPRQMAKRLLAALTVGVLAALLLAACGGSSQGGSSAPETEAESPAAKPPAKAKNPSPSAHPRPHYEGGEKSVERYGSEAEGQGKEAILNAEHSYLSALADEDFSTACSYLSATVTRSLERLATPQLKARGCPPILPKLLAPTAPAISREQAEGEIKKVRVEGDQAFVIFHAPGARLYVLTMRREGGHWKATTIAASILVPDL